MTAYWERALSQRTYPGVGDIDDCWVVATVWAARRATHQSQNLPNCKIFRAAAGDPDNGYKDGGTLDEINNAVNRLYPHLNDVKFAKQYGWLSFIGYLNRGYTASLATNSRYLSHRYGFYGTHQIAVFKRSGKLYVMNPLQAQGSDPTVISEADLKRATYNFANGWVMADMIPPIDLGKVVVKAQGIRFWSSTTRGGWTASARTTGGFSAVCTPPRTYNVNGTMRKMVFLSTGGYAGKWIELNAKRTFTP